MRTTTRLITTAAAVASLCLAAQPAAAAEWESSDQWAEWEAGGYTLRNNIWGDGAGSQTISADSHASWSVDADHPDTGGVKSYPHAEKVIARPLDEIESLTSDFAVDVPQDGAYATAYDIWLGDDSYEIMLWLNQEGEVGPIGSQVTTVDVGGHSWDVYKGDNGGNEVFSFIRHGETEAGTVDLKAVMTWIADQGWYAADEVVDDVQLGFEITSSAGGMTFTCTDYAVTGS